MDLASKLFKGDRVIWIIFMFLCLISVVEVFSATSTIAYKNANHWAPIVRHATFLLGGFVMVCLLYTSGKELFEDRKLRGEMRAGFLRERTIAFPLGQ